MQEEEETKVLANGVFDILHPGHLHYLKRSSELGDLLTVVLSRDILIDKDPVLTERNRLEMVEALDPVDQAFLGFENPDTHIYDTVEKADPDIIALGFDQDFDPRELERDLEDHDFDVRVVRISKRPGRDISSTDIRKKIREGK